MPFLVWPTTATMVGLKSPTKGETLDNNGKPIYFDGVDNSAYVTGKAPHSPRGSWIYADSESFAGVRVDVGNDSMAVELAKRYGPMRQTCPHLSASKSGKGTAKSRGTGQARLHALGILTSCDRASSLLKAQ